MTLFSKDLVHTSQNSVMTCDSSPNVTLSVTRDLDMLNNPSKIFSCGNHKIVFI